MKFSVPALLGLLTFAALSAPSQELPYNGVSSDLSNLYRLSNAKTFSISPENLTGEKGEGGMATREAPQMPPATSEKDGK